MQQIGPVVVPTAVDEVVIAHEVSPALVSKQAACCQDRRERVGWFPVVFLVRCHGFLDHWLKRSKIELRHGVGQGVM